MPALQRPLLNMMDFVYGIRNWQEHFETSESRKRKGPLSWVAVPTKHDGRGYRRAIRAKHQVEALCGWWSILQVAAKMPAHGLLADRDGPLAAEDIADKTGLPTKIYITAFNVMSDEQIGWLEKLPWNKNLDFAGNLAALSRHQQAPADSSGHQQIPADTSGHQQRKKERAILGNASRHQQIPADTSGHQQIPADTSGRQQIPADTSVQTGHNSTDRQSPLPSPKGGQSADLFVTDFFEARQQICKKILGGKNPSRLWSRDAEAALAELVKGGDGSGLPQVEIDRIAWFRTLPPDDEIPELKNRRPVTETALVQYWGDEFQRADSYWKKNQGSLNGTGLKKEEPARWREFFRERYPEAENLFLPATFWQLPADQRKEWEIGHEDWEIQHPEAALG